MNTEDIVLLGIKDSVLALSKETGEIHWATELPGIGMSFVGILSDSKRVFAHGGGKLHCLALDTGERLWTNKLPGYGYGFATIAFPNGGSFGADPTVIAALAAANEASSASGAGGASGAS